MKKLLLFDKKNMMKVKFLAIPILILFLFSSCDTTNPEFNPDKIFIEVRNGTPDSYGEFEVFNFSSQSIFIHHIQFPSCSFFTYSIEQFTDSGLVKLSFNETQGKWMIPIFNPDSVYQFCELYMNPIELKSFHSFKQKITGLDQVGEFRLTIFYSLSGVPNASYNKLIADYKVGY
ncbi:MAG: hypothetical protein Q7S39_11195 [Ignavibacteria bacterium]|nr:hypothetical protein [Ignavibacteria bacterium]